MVPFLFSLFPVLFLYRHNIRSVPLARIFPALGVSLAIAVVFWLLLCLVARPAGKRSLLLFLFLLLFHSYGALYGWLAPWLPGDSHPILAHAMAFVLPGGLWLLLSAAVLRSAGDFRVLNRVLRQAVIFLLAWNLAGILFYHGRSQLASGRLPGENKTAAAQIFHGQPGGPDIYCFVLDEFAALESARSLFGYDNSGFEAALRRQGFFVARNSRSRFHLTELAIADLLNPGEFEAKNDPYPLIRRNAVAAFLKERGYRIVEFPLEPAMFMEAADQRHHYSLLGISIFFDDFYRVLFERSLLRFLPDRWQRQGPDSSRYFRERVLQVFEQLPATIRSPGPKFVYIHLYCPHEPFVFTASGAATRAKDFWRHDDPRFYLGQYIFTSRQMMETVARILKESPAAPVIMILSDHGYRGSRGRVKNGRQVPAAEMFKVFNALYLPGPAAAAIDPALAPRDNFRLVFSHCFAAPLSTKKGH